VAEEPSEVVSTNSDAVSPNGDSVAVEEPTPPSETVTEAVVAGPGLCENCGDPIESDDQRDLSSIRFRKALDRKCFLAAKGAKK
jgi:hypothetical protein